MASDALQGTYLLFAGDDHYPQGGWDDFVGAFVSLETAISWGRAKSPQPYRWWHVVDVVSRREVASSADD